MLATNVHLDLIWWTNTITLIVSAFTIFFFLKKIIIKSIANDIKELNYKVSPNGNNTQNIGDIAARSEDAIKEVKLIVSEIRQESHETRDILIEHIGWHKGKQDS
jgi:hypothetical protein